MKIIRDYLLWETDVSGRSGSPSFSQYWANPRELFIHILMDIRAGQNCSNEKSQSKPEGQGNLFIHFEDVLTLGAEAREGGKLSLLCHQCKCQLDLPRRDNSKCIENAHYDQNGQFLGSAGKNTYFHRNACWRNRVILLPGTYFPIVNRPFSTRRSCTIKGLAHLTFGSFGHECN